MDLSPAHIFLQSSVQGDSLAKLVSDAAVFLIVGGLCMLGLVVVLVLLRTVFPSGKPRAGGMIQGKLERRLLTTPSLPEESRPAQLVPIAREKFDHGRRAGLEAKPRSIDDVLSHIEREGWGEPRVLRMLDNRTVIRYYRCRECVPAHRVVGAVDGCGFQAGFLGGAFESMVQGTVRVAEVACRTSGLPACEFEVRFA